MKTSFVLLMTSLSNDGKIELALTLLAFALLLLLIGYAPDIWMHVKGLFHPKHPSP